MSTHTLFRTVPCDSNVTMRVDGYLEHLCPHVDEVDRGLVTIVWKPLGETLELHSLMEYLDGFSELKISHEQITDRIRFDLILAPQVQLISVTTTWNTAGLEVTCSTSPTPVGTQL